MDISFIIVNYQSDHYLKKCLESIKKKAIGFSHEIIVINNDPLTTLSDLKAETIILNQTTNIGFARACNLGVKAAKGRYLFFLNPDCELLTNNFIELIELLRDPVVGICAPRLMSAAAMPQPWGCGLKTSLWDIIANNFGYIKSKKLWLTPFKTEVDWVSGGALLVSKDLFASCNGFDERFFLYFEDQDLCLRIKDSGKKIIVYPDVKILHHEGKSHTHSKTQKKYYYTSQDYFLAKHNGKFQAKGVKFLRYLALFLTK